METEEQVEDFIADVCDLVARVLPVSVGGDAFTPSGEVSSLSLQERDRQLYQRASRAGMAVAGMVAFSVDAVME